MAAGLGFKTFTTGEVLSAANVNGYLMQGILVFASAAARDAAITSPQEGQFAYLKDTNVTTYYTGSAWANIDTTGMTNPMTTTGDTIYSSSGSTPARLGIGTAGQVLQVNSGATAPEWAAPVSGGMTSLGSGTLSGSSVDITGIPGTYNDLVLYVNNPSQNSGAADSHIQIRVNSNTNSDYAWNGLAQTTNFNNNGASSWALWDGSNNYFGLSTTAYKAGVYFRLFNYANTTAQKTMMFNIGASQAMNNVNGNGVLKFAYATTAVTSLQILSSFSTFTGGTYNLFGVK
jgi:hypothetical protein